jgi:hypothetical protein
MINSIGAQQAPSNIYATQAKQSTRPPGVPAGAKEAFAIDLDKLFTPSERKTMKNMKSYAKAEGMTNVQIQELEASLVTAKYSEQKAGNNISIKKALGQQIRGMEDGFTNKSSLSLDFLQKLCNDFDQSKGTELFA